MIPVTELEPGNVFSTDGYTVTTVVRLPKTSRVFVQCELDGDLKTAALPDDTTLPVWTPDPSDARHGAA